VNEISGILQYLTLRRNVCKVLVYMAIRFLNTVINAVGKVLKLPITVVPATLIHQIINGLILRTIIQIHGRFS